MRSRAAINMLWDTSVPLPGDSGNQNIIVAALKARVEALEGGLAAAEHKHDKELLQLKAMYRSRSWRYTAPFRAISNAYRREAAMLNGALSGVLGGLLRWIHLHPQLKRGLKRMMWLVPPLRNQMMRFSQARPYAGVSADQPFWMIEPDAGALRYWDDALR